MPTATYPDRYQSHRNWASVCAWKEVKKFRSYEAYITAKRALASGPWLGQNAPPPGAAKRTSPSGRGE